LKCEKAQKQCPGYRDLCQVVFRDESKRVIQKARQCDQGGPLAKDPAPISIKISQIFESKFPAPWPHPVRILPALSQSINELGVNFLFTNYFYNQPPFYNHYHTWVAQSYHENLPGHVLRTVIEAVGMAGLANVSNSSRFKAAFEQQYRKASFAMRETLNDPAQVTADSTLLAVILFELLEVRQFFVRHCT
jgi:hypothetical protein